MLLVTGGAGFIGSNVVAALNDAGRDVAVCDVLGHDGKWRNLAKRRLADFVPPSELMDWLKGRRLEAVIHLGAISETTATDGDLVIETNFRLSMRLLDWCTANATPLIYASSAATYGDGSAGLWRRPVHGRPEEAAADEPLRLEQASVRHGGGRARRARRTAAAAMGRAEVLQRVRPQRISQGHDDERAGAALRRHQGRAARAIVQVAPRRHRRRRPAARLHLCRRRRARDDVAARDASASAASSMSAPAPRAAFAT